MSIYSLYIIYYLYQLFPVKKSKTDVPFDIWLIEEISNGKPSLQATIAIGHLDHHGRPEVSSIKFQINKSYW